MRIGFVADSYPPDLGGIEVVVSELAQRMALNGHEVEVFAHVSHGEAPSSEMHAGVLVHRFGVPGPSKEMQVSPSMVSALVRNRRRFDVVHAHNYHAIPALAAAIAGMRPLVFTPHYHGGGHSSIARIAHVVYRPTSRLLFRACAHIICVSQAEALALSRDFPRISAPVSIVPNGVATEGFANAQPFDCEPDIVIAAGRMEPYKQFDRIALAAKALPSGTEIVLLGDGSARSSIERLIERDEIRSRVRLLGRVSDGDLRRWFRTAKVLVSMSKHESFGLTIVEALAAGTPVVASDIPAHRETSEAQPRGAVRLVSSDASAEVIADSVVSAAKDGLPAGVTVRSWDDATQDVLHIYETVRASASRSS